MAEDRIERYQKGHDALVLVDHDGTAMDTMEVKHRRCFAPCLIEEWSLEPWADEVMESWLQINLYSAHRGCNRFEALAIMLNEVDLRFRPVAGVDVLRDWVDHAKERSNDALRRQITQTGHTILCKALAWSNAVDRQVRELTIDDLLPFPGAAEGVTAAHAQCDVIVLSGAGRAETENEWRYYGMDRDTDLTLGQEDGTKEVCLRALLAKGYDLRRVLLVGDDLGDAELAAANGIGFYPVLVRQEAGSWMEFASTALPLFLAGEYAEYGEMKRQLFEEGLQV